MSRQGVIYLLTLTLRALERIHGEGVVCATAAGISRLEVAALHLTCGLRGVGHRDQHATDMMACYAPTPAGNKNNGMQGGAVG